MLNLTDHLNKVRDAGSLGERKEAMVTMIVESHAKAETKSKAMQKVANETNPDRLLAFAYNYAMSGEGLKVV
jgi:hypothetical protein